MSKIAQIKLHKCILSDLMDFIIGVQQGEADFSYHALLAQTFPENAHPNAVAHFAIYGDTQRRRGELDCRWLHFNFLLASKMDLEVLANNCFVRDAQWHDRIYLATTDIALNTFEVSADEFELVDLLSGDS